MKIVAAVILVAILIASFGVWKITSDTHLINSRIKTAEKEIASLKLERKDLDRYKDEKILPLEALYFELFNDIKEVSFYYRAISEIKVPGAKDLASIEEFFKPSQYKGVRCVDIVCGISLKDLSDICIFETLYKIVQNRPVDILYAEIKKDAVTLTMRLYGS